MKKIQSLLASVVPASALLLAVAAVPRAQDAPPAAVVAAPVAPAQVPAVSPPEAPAVDPLPIPGEAVAAPAPAGATPLPAAMTPVPPEPIALRDVHLDLRLGRYV